MSEPKNNAGEIVMGGWHLDKRVTMGQLLTIIAMFVAGFWAIADLKEQIVTNASDIQLQAELRREEDKRIDEKYKMVFDHMNVRFEEAQKDTNKILGRIERSIDKLGDKIDGKVDKK